MIRLNEDRSSDMHSASTIYVVFGGVQPEIMKVKELYDYVQDLPDNTRLLFVNLACFAGKWRKLAQLGRGTSRRDVMVEVSWTHNPAVNHISGSRKCQCSFFGRAWIQAGERRDAVYPCTANKLNSCYFYFPQISAQREHSALFTLPPK